MSTILAWFAHFFTDMWNSIENGFWKLLGSIFQMGADLLASVPVPAFLSSVGQNIADIPPVVLYFIAPMHLSYGLALLSSAVLARSLLSLIPIVGAAFR